MAGLEGRPRARRAAQVTPPPLPLPPGEGRPPSSHGPPSSHASLGPASPLPLLSPPLLSPPTPLSLGADLLKCRGAAPPRCGVKRPADGANHVCFLGAEVMPLGRYGGSLTHRRPRTPTGHTCASAAAAEESPTDLGGVLGGVVGDPGSLLHSPPHSAPRAECLDALHEYSYGATSRVEPSRSLLGALLGTAPPSRGTSRWTRRAT